MRTCHGLILVFVLSTLLLSCELPSDDDPGIDFVLSDIVGIWEFPSQNGDSAITVEIFTPPNVGVSIDWDHDEYSYECHGHGPLEGKVLTYTYGYESTVGGSTGPASEVVLEVELTFSLRDDRLKVVCSGEGPLDGKVFTTGALDIP